jgi:hypothetical protein
MPEPTFDIFSGQPDQNALWLEAVVGLSNAHERMQQIAEGKPGRYFLFAPTGSSVIARIETFQKEPSKSNSAEH